ncbi:MAG: molybdate ABC transporter permease subunit [Phycisphaerae bacterium]
MLNASILSLTIAILATILAALIAIPLAFFMSRRPFRGRSLLEALIMLPLVLPPTVVGYLLLVLLGTHGLIGTWLYRWFHYSLFMRVEAAVLAAAVVAIPLCYIPSRAAFSAVDRDLEDVAVLFGASRRQLFFRISLPLAARGVFAGAILAFARALGEFGATMMVYTWQPGKETLPILIYIDAEYDNFAHALPAVLLLSAMSLALIWVYNRSLSDPHRP